ncbi:MAG: hypothetical protein NTY75_03835 [Candidatus Shapirobacteria bacterium]|nr:hypothetical protein [Candidatus Shapirobacteria bacterium]
MMKTILSTVLIASLWGALCLFPKISQAQYYSQGNNNFNVTIDKKIRPITDVNYYDNIPASQKVFIEKDQMDFELIVENTGNQNLTNLTVKDTLPKYFTPQLYFGTFDKETAIIQTQIDSLGVGESKVFNIRGIVSNLPASDWAKQLVKLTNRADVYNNNASDTDYASYFAEKRVNPVTGADSLVLGSLVSLTMLTTAFGLRKLARGY